MWKGQFKLPNANVARHSFRSIVGRNAEIGHFAISALAFGMRVSHYCFIVVRSESANTAFTEFCHTFSAK